MKKRFAITSAAALLAVGAFSIPASADSSGYLSYFDAGEYFLEGSSDRQVVSLNGDRDVRICVSESSAKDIFAGTEQLPIEVRTTEGIEVVNPGDCLEMSADRVVFAVPQGADLPSDSLIEIKKQ